MASMCHSTELAVIHRPKWNRYCLCPHFWGEKKTNGKELRMKPELIFKIDRFQGLVGSVYGRRIMTTSMCDDLWWSMHAPISQCLQMSYTSTHWTRHWLDYVTAQYTLINNDLLSTIQFYHLARFNRIITCKTHTRTRKWDVNVVFGKNISKHCWNLPSKNIPKELLTWHRRLERHFCFKFLFLTNELIWSRMNIGRWSLAAFRELVGWTMRLCTNWMGD